MGNPNDRCPKCDIELSVWEEVFGEEHDSSKCVPMPNWKPFWEQVDKENPNHVRGFLVLLKLAQSQLKEWGIKEKKDKEGYKAMSAIGNNQTGDWWCPQHGYPLPCVKCGLGDYEAGQKAGQEYERKRWLLMTDPEKFPDSFTRDLIIRTRAQAFKEVKEFINMNPQCWSADKDEPCYKIKLSVWQSKLKEWNIDES